jgi:HK97 family phage major capsid protein
MAIEQNEVKEALDSLKNGFEEFKKVNDQRLAAIAKGGSTADFDEKLDKINDMITKHERKQTQFFKEQEKLAADRAAEQAAWQETRKQEEHKFEARLNRAALGLGGDTGEELRRGHGVLERKAYDRFLRKGDQALKEEERKVLTIGTDATGGYLAPAEYQREIIKSIVEISPFRSLVNVKTIGTSEFNQPKRTQTTTATRVAEVGTRSETQNPAWGLLSIKAPEAFAESRVSMQNLEDSAFNLEDELRQDFAEQFGVLEGAEIVNGDGVGKILGFLQANAAGTGTPIAFEVSGTAATIADVDGGANGLMSVFYGLKTAYSANGRWALNRNTLGNLRKLKDLSDSYIWQPGLTAGAPPTILGAPYVEVPDMPNQAANAFPIAFGDWKKAFTLIDRVDMVITRDPFTLASVGQVKFHARRRMGGQIVLGEALRLLKCSA